MKNVNDDAAEAAGSQARKRPGFHLGAGMSRVLLDGWQPINYQTRAALVRRDWAEWDEEAGRYMNGFRAIRLTKLGRSICAQTVANEVSPERSEGTQS